MVMFDSVVFFSYLKEYWKDFFVLFLIFFGLLGFIFFLVERRKCEEYRENKLARNFLELVYL